MPIVSVVTATETVVHKYSYLEVTGCLRQAPALPTSILPSESHNKDVHHNLAL